MSRSRKNLPITGNCAGSDREWKRRGHKSERQQERVALLHGCDVPDRRTVMSEWASDKDGKSYVHDTERAVVVRRK